MKYVKDILFILSENRFFSSSQATITSISLRNPTQSDVRITSVDSDSGTFNATNSTSLEMNFLPNLEYNNDLTITLNSTSATIKSPINVVLAIYGCATPLKRLTKAQVESGKIAN